MDLLLLLGCFGLVPVGLVVAMTAFRLVPRKPPVLPPAQTVTDGKYVVGGPRSPRVRVCKSQLVGGILVIVVAVLTILTIFALDPHVADARPAERQLDLPTGSF